MRLALPCCLALAACGGSLQTNAHGSASYARPASTGGKQVRPQPKSDDLKVTVTLTGAGTFDKVGMVVCALNGNFSESVATTGTVSDGGNYVSTFATESAGANASNPACGAIKNLKVSSLTTVEVEGSLPTSDSNCSDYCDAKAAATCQGSADVNCVASFKATCQTDCKSKSSIEGHGEISATALASANSKAAGSGTVDAQVDLVFNAVH